MQQPLIKGLRPSVEELAHYSLRPEVSLALAAGFQIRQQKNGRVKASVSHSMALSLHWLLCHAHKNRGIRCSLAQLCSAFKTAHLTRTKRERESSFYRKRLKTLLAVCLNFNVLEGELTTTGKRIAAELDLKLLNPDRIWQLYLKEPAPEWMKDIPGESIRAAWATYTPEQQQQLAGTERSLDWAEKHFLPLPEPELEPEPTEAAVSGLSIAVHNLDLIHRIAKEILGSTTHEEIALAQLARALAEARADLDGETGSRVSELLLTSEAIANAWQRRVEYLRHKRNQILAGEGEI
jgi:hypothetical protein